MPGEGWFNHGKDGLIAAFLSILFLSILLFPKQRAEGICGQGALEAVALHCTAWERSLPALFCPFCCQG